MVLLGSVEIIYGTSFNIREEKSFHMRGADYDTAPSSRYSHETKCDYVP